MTRAVTDPGARGERVHRPVRTEAAAVETLNNLWADEGCSWSADHTGYGRDKGEWCLTLSWNTDSLYILEADWVTLDWHFYGDTIGEALNDAAWWCVDLAPWEPCPECDGRGEWQGVPCDRCATSGLSEAAS